MKVSIVVTTVVAAFTILFLLVFLRGCPDDPSGVVTNELLKKRSLPADLPNIGRVANPNTASGPLYEDAYEYYASHQRAIGEFLNAGSYREEDEHVKMLASKFIEAMDAAEPKPGFGDEIMQAKPKMGDRYDGAQYMTAYTLLEYANYLRKEDRLSRAALISKAVLIYGQRLYRLNQRLQVRQTGLQCIAEGATSLYNNTPKDDPEGEAALRWLDAAEDLLKQWQPKLAVIESMEPQVADLLLIAKHDEDVSFRAAAIRVLGMVKFNPRGRGNRRVVANMIEEALESEDPAIREAAEAAASVTREDIRKM